MSSSSALPLKVTPASTPARSNPASEAASGSRTPTKQSVAANPGEISSPHELTAFVETLLEQLDTKFDEMSSQMLDRMAQMSNRVDALEHAIQDIISGDCEWCVMIATIGSISYMVLAYLEILAS